MFDNYYLIGSLFIFVNIIFTYYIGSAITKQTEGFSYDYIVGFLVLNFFVAIGTIPVSLLNLSWMISAVYIGIMYVVLLIFIIVRFVKCHLNPFHIINFVSKQWFLIFVSLITLAISLTYIEWIWENNGLDDGYYLGEIATLPYTGFSTQPATGLPMSGFNVYLFNGYYVELSVYSYFLKIPATVLTRVFYAFQHYFLFTCCIQVLAKKICSWLSIELKERQYQYFAFILLLFGISYTVTKQYHILYLVDGWQTISAMYFGSCVVRCMGYLLVLLPFIDKEKIGIKEIVLVACIGLVLMSQSTIALPIMVILPISYLIIHWCFDYHTPIFFGLAFILLAMVVGVSIYLGDVSQTQSVIYSTVIESGMTLVFVACACIFLLSFLTKNIKIIKWNALLVLTALLMIVNPINNIFEFSSVYDFVANRAITMLEYSFIITAVIYFLLFVYVKLLKKSKFGLLSFACTLVLMIGSLGISHLCNDGLPNAIQIIMDNSQIIPQSTVKLGDVLEEKYEETKQTNIVLLDEGTYPNGYIHSVAIIIRTQSPNTICLSAFAGGRYGFPEKDSGIGNFSQDTQDAFYAYCEDPNETTFKQFKEEIKGIKINTIIVTSESFDEDLKTIGYTLYDSVMDEKAGLNYYVYSNVTK